MIDERKCPCSNTFLINLVGINLDMGNLLIERKKERKVHQDGSLYIIYV